MTARRSIFRLALGSLATSAFVFACSGWDPSRPFEREAPQVNEAISLYDGGEAGSAQEILEDYLLTGHCAEGNIGTPNRLNERPNGTFDFGLVLFKIGEAYGQRFGDEEIDAGPKLDPNIKGLRSGTVECALRIVRRVAEDATQPVALRARARYLEGNLLFLMTTYQEAVTAYDKALELAPGMGDGGPLGAPDSSDVKFTPDPVGRDAAWNRAIALRRIEEKKDAGSDGGGNDGGGDGGGDSGGQDSGNGDGGDNQGDGGKDSGKGDDQKDSGQNKDDNKDAGNDAQSPPPKPDPKDQDAGAQPQQPPPPSRQSQDERILDQLENAPTVQQHAAQVQGARRKAVRGMADK